MQTKDSSARRRIRIKRVLPGAHQVNNSRQWRYAVELACGHFTYAYCYNNIAFTNQTACCPYCPPYKPREAAPAICSCKTREGDLLDLIHRLESTLLDGTPYMRELAEQELPVLRERLTYVKAYGLK